MVAQAEFVDAGPQRRALGAASVDPQLPPRVRGDHGGEGVHEEAVPLHRDEAPAGDDERGLAARNREGRRGRGVGDGHDRGAGGREVPAMRDGVRLRDGGVRVQ
ncbi:hypothetical protein GCM10010252_37890 [Streptomyces aureoverticillatus]|nr:hypothetical protein GCM10010252_37890 [Streptomyces aureoverticillatus]